MGGTATVGGLALALAMSACQDTSGGATGASGGGGGAPSGTFTPRGCGFQVAPRPEYGDFAASSPVVGPSPNIRRVRLGLGGNVAAGSAGHADPATAAGFGWQTDEGTLASEVTWGSAPDPAGWPAENRSGGVTWRTPQGTLNGAGDERMHEAYVCGLEPGATYYYRVGGGPVGQEVWSEVYTFTTTPSDPSTPVKIVVSGDSRGQQGDAWRLLQKRVLLSGAALQLFSGDMINLAPDQAEWEKWLDSSWKDGSGELLTLGRLLTLSAHGNHDAHTSLFFGNLILPQDVATYPKYGELFFSVDVGPVHVVVVDDAFIVAPQGDPDYKGVLSGWLHADLTAANARRADVPWVVAMHHHPEYSSSLHGKDPDVLRGRAFFGPIWDEHHVDLVVAGHDHDYERTKPLTGPTDSPTVHDSPSDGTVYLVCAGAGADPYSAGTSTFTAQSRDFKSGGALGFYSILDASKATLRIQAHELRADGTDPMFDDVTLTK